MRVSKFEREQRERREAVKRRMEEEKKKEVQYKLRQLELAALAARASEQREEEAERLREEEEEEKRKTGGISFLSYLKPFPVDSDDDKVLLPESALLQLTRDSAFELGPLHFRLSSSKSAVITHCGVREFSAAEGTIGLPRKIINSFHCTPHNEVFEQLGEICIKYILLPKISFAKLQPVESSFGSIAHIKTCLTENLRLHATLSEGDILSIWYRGEVFQLRVQELKPASSGSLIDTDVEVDLSVSEETERLYAPIPPVAPLPTASSSAVSLPLPSLSLDPEPPNGPDVIECRVKTIQGATKTRRFLRNHPLKSLLDFAWIESGGPAAIPQAERLQITKRFPLEVFSYADAASGKSFAEFGLNNSQELFLVGIRC